MAEHDALLVYDGDCGFCQRVLDVLQRSLRTFPPAQPSQRIHYAAYGLSSQDVTRYVWLLSEHTRYRGHAAFTALLRMQPSRWVRLTGAILSVPPLSWVMQMGYALLSRFRHRLPGGTPACSLSTPHSS